MEMHVVGSIIARLGSNRLKYKNILPFFGKPMLGVGIETLRKAKLVDEIVVSTESELVARVAHDFGVQALRRPSELAEDNVPSMPVFRHLIEQHPCDVHVTLNINLPLCQPEVVDRAIVLAQEHGESLSRPVAVWAQTHETIMNYGDPWKITAAEFEDKRAGNLDIHTEEDLLEVYRFQQGDIPGW
jgi:CMP-N-acetylneuraminic acid synthetase